MSGKSSGVPAVRDPRIRPRDPRTYGPNANQAKGPSTTTAPSTSSSKSSSTPSSTNPVVSSTNSNSKPSTSDDSSAKKSSSGLRVDLHEAASDSPEQMRKRISDWISVLTNSPNSTSAVGIFFRDYHGVQGISMLRALFEVSFLFKPFPYMKLAF